MKAPFTVTQDDIDGYEKDMGFRGIGERMIKAGIWKRKEAGALGEDLTRARDRVDHLQTLAGEQEQAGRPVEASSTRASARTCAALWGIRE